MKIFDFPQRSPEWFEVRKGVITASRVGMFCAEPFGICLTVPEIKAALDAQGIGCKGLTRRDDLLSILPNADAYRRLVDPAQTLIDEIMGEQADGDDRPPDWDTFWTKRGTEMEPVALADYERRTGYAMERVGFVLHDCGKFGCSPDGMFPTSHPIPHGLEIKCPEGKTHLRYLREGVLPQEYLCQVHTSMAVTGLDRWDFFSFHPNLPPLLLMVERDDFTNQLERGLILLGEEMRRQEIALAEKWRDEFENAGSDAPGATELYIWCEHCGYNRSLTTDQLKDLSDDVVETWCPECEEAMLNHGAECPDHIHLDLPLLPYLHKT